MSARASACTSRDARSSTCGVASPIRRRTAGVRRVDVAARVLDDEGCDRGVRQPAHAARPARRRRAGGVTYWPEFASGRQGEHPRAMAALSQGRAPRDRQAAVARRSTRVGSGRSRRCRCRSRCGSRAPRTATTRSTYGWLVGEVIRRIDGRSLGTFFAEEIAQPLGLEFWIGLPESRGASRRAAHRQLVPAGGAARRGDARRCSRSSRAPTRCSVGRSTSTARSTWSAGTSRAVHAAEIGAANGITNARSLSRFYAGLVGPLPDAPAAPLLTAAQIDAARERQTEGSDRCLFFETSFGLGFFTASRSRRTAAPAPSATRGRAVRWASPTPPTRSRRAM